MNAWLKYLSGSGGSLREGDREGTWGKRLRRRKGGRCVLRVRISLHR